MTSGRVVEAQRTFQDHTLDATAHAVVGSGPAQPLLVPVLVVVKRLEQGSMVRLQRRRQRHTQPPRALVRPRRECAAVAVQLWYSQMSGSDPARLLPVPV